MAHLFNVVVYDSFNRKNVKISTTYYFLDFSFFMSQDDAHYQNHLNAPNVEAKLFSAKWGRGYPIPQINLGQTFFANRGQTPFLSHSGNFFLGSYLWSFHKWRGRGEPP